MLDIMLPGLSGYRILERLRAAQVWTPVLVLTAKDGEYDEADAFDLGADDYLVDQVVVLGEQAVGGIVTCTPRRHPLGEVMQRTLDRIPTCG